MSAPQATRGELRSFVDRIERVHEERKALGDDIRDIYAEAKSNGFDVKALKIVIGRRAKDADALTELDAIVETYEAALGTPVALARAPARAPEPAAVKPESRPAPIKPRPADNLDISDFLDRRSVASSA